MLFSLRRLPPLTYANDNAEWEVLSKKVQFRNVWESQVFLPPTLPTSFVLAHFPQETIKYESKTGEKFTGQEKRNPLSGSRCNKFTGFLRFLPENVELLKVTNHVTKAFELSAVGNAVTETWFPSWKLWDDIKPYRNIRTDFQIL